MRVYCVCGLDIDTGFICGIKAYTTLETAINRAIVIIKENINNDDYVTRFSEEAKSYLRAGLNYKDKCGIVCILVRDAI